MWAGCVFDVLWFDCLLPALVVWLVFVNLYPVLNLGLWLAWFDWLSWLVWLV